MHVWNFNCSICLDHDESSDQKSVVCPGLHVFCRECIGAWQKKNKSCPICRATLFDSPILLSDIPKLTWTPTVLLHDRYLRRDLFFIFVGSFISYFIQKILSFY